MACQRTQTQLGANPPNCITAAPKTMTSARLPKKASPSCLPTDASRLKTHASKRSARRGQPPKLHAHNAALCIHHGEAMFRQKNVASERSVRRDNSETARTPNAELRIAWHHNTWVGSLTECKPRRKVSALATPDFRSALRPAVTCLGISPIWLSVASFLHGTPRARGTTSRCCK